MRSLTLVVILVMGISACGDGGTPPPPSGPGTIGARLTSPNGAEGAAVVRLTGRGIGTVTAQGARTFLGRRGDTVDVVIARETAGELTFAVALTDTTALPAATLLEVSGPDDQLRSGLSGYTLEWVR